MRGHCRPSCCVIDMANCYALLRITSCNEFSRCDSHMMKNKFACLVFGVSLWRLQLSQRYWIRVCGRLIEICSGVGVKVVWFYWIISVLMWHIVLETLNASEQDVLDIFGEQIRVFRQVFQGTSSSCKRWPFSNFPYCVAFSNGLWQAVYNVDRDGAPS